VKVKGAKIIPQKGNAEVFTTLLVMTKLEGGNHSTSHLSYKDLLLWNDISHMITGLFAEVELFILEQFKWPVLLNLGNSQPHKKM